MCNGASRWGQALDHWCLAVFFVEYTWLYKGVTFVFLLSFPLSLPFDWTLRCWVCVCCFVLLYFGCCVVLCVKKMKKMLITKKELATMLNKQKNTSVFQQIYETTSPEDYYWPPHLTVNLKGVCSHGINCYSSISDLTLLVSGSHISWIMGNNPGTSIALLASLLLKHISPTKCHQTRQSSVSVLVISVSEISQLYCFSVALSP